MKPTKYCVKPLDSLMKPDIRLKFPGVLEDFRGYTGRFQVSEGFQEITGVFLVADRGLQKFLRNIAVGIFQRGFWEFLEDSRGFRRRPLGFSENFRRFQFCEFGVSRGLMGISKGYGGFLGFHGNIKEHSGEFRTISESF